MNNRILQTAHLLTRLTLMVTVAVYAAIVLVVIYWHIAPEAFAEWHIANPFHAGTSTFNLQRGPHAEGLALTDIERGPLYWLLLRTTCFFALTVLALRKVLHILKGVRSAQTFYTSHITHFQHLAGIGLLYAGLSVFNWGVIAGESILHLKVPFMPLLFALGCLVLAEIFREGERLRQDAEAII